MACSGAGTAIAALDVPGLGTSFVYTQYDLHYTAFFLFANQISDRCPTGRRAQRGDENLGVAAFGRKFAISAARSQPFFLFQGRVSKYNCFAHYQSSPSVWSCSVELIGGFIFMIECELERVQISTIISRTCTSGKLQTRCKHVATVHGVLPVL